MTALGEKRHFRNAPRLVATLRRALALHYMSSRQYADGRALSSRAQARDLASKALVTPTIIE
jgi:hypothetical protein